MAANTTDGPSFTSGNLSAILASIFGAAVGDPNPDAGPNGYYQGAGMIDPRFWFNKDQLQGYVGKVPMHYMEPQLRTVGQIPMAVSASNIAAAQTAAAGVKMTLATANTTGITVNLPYIPFNQAGVAQLATGAAVQIAPITMDFGFAFGNVTSGNTTVTVGNSASFWPGMPIVIAGVGNAGGTVPLLTNVVSVPTATTITIQATPLSSANPTAIGTGNLWGPSETWSTLPNMAPTAALPWVAAGPGLMLDERQALTRGIQIAGAAGGTGGTFAVVGLDIYNVTVHETVTVGAGAVSGWSVKTYKSILSVTPNFTDGSHNYTVGTSDVFGSAYRMGIWEDLEACWAGSTMNSSQGFVAGLALTSTSTATSADVRGTIQTSASGGGTGIGVTASNGTISALLPSGNRLMIRQSIPAVAAILANSANYATLFGLAQF